MAETYDLGSKLKEYRKKKNMSQAQLASLLGKSTSTIYGYETNQIIPPFETLCAISDILSADMEVLLEIWSSVNKDKRKIEYYLD